MSKDIGYYKNPLGNMTVEELIELKQQSKQERAEWIANFRITKQKCPPDKYRNGMCFYCEQCFENALRSVKIKKKKKEDKQDETNSDLC